MASTGNCSSAFGPPPTDLGFLRSDEPSPHGLRKIANHRRRYVSHERLSVDQPHIASLVIAARTEKQGKGPGAKSVQSEDTIFLNLLDFPGLRSQIGAAVCKTFIAGSIPAVASVDRSMKTPGPPHL